MGEHFVEVDDKQELEQLFARSHDEPVIIFKHSLTCPISSAAYDEMRRVGGPVALVVVQHARAISNEVESRTGVRHESPQALVLRDGEAVWSASHWKVTADAVERAREENTNTEHRTRDTGDRIQSSE
jgi:bacillithiol system protein YtxJ